jgi:hypothetical protein
MAFCILWPLTRMSCWLFRTLWGQQLSGCRHAQALPEPQARYCDAHALLFLCPHMVNFTNRPQPRLLMVNTRMLMHSCMCHIHVWHSRHLFATVFVTQAFCTTIYSLSCRITSTLYCMARRLRTAVDTRLQHPFFDISIINATACMMMKWGAAEPHDISVTNQAPPQDIHRFHANVDVPCL